MRCAIFVGLLVTVIALGEARRLSSTRLSALKARIQAARQLTDPSNTDTAVVQERNAVRKIPDTTLEVIMYAARCIQDLTTVTDPPLMADFEMERCFMAIGSVMYYANESTPDSHKDFLDDVFLLHVEFVKCELLEERGDKLGDAIENGVVTGPVVDIFVELEEVVTCHCKNRQKEKEELDRLMGEIDNAEGTSPGPEQGTTQGPGQVSEPGRGLGARATAKLQDDFQRKLNRLLASPTGTRALSQLILRKGGKGDKKGNQEEESSTSSDDKKRSHKSGKSGKSGKCEDNKCGTEPRLLSTTLDAIMFAADCALDQTLYQNEQPLCDEVFEVLFLYTEGNDWVEDEIQKHIRQIRCEEWTVLANDLHNSIIVQDPTLSVLWGFVEDEVDLLCAELTEEDRMIRELMKLLAKQRRKK